MIQSDVDDLRAGLLLNIELFNKEKKNNSNLRNVIREDLSKINNKLKTDYKIGLFTYVTEESSAIKKYVAGGLDLHTVLFFMGLEDLIIEFPNMYTVAGDVNVYREDKSILSTIADLKHNVFIYSPLENIYISANILMEHNGYMVCYTRKLAKQIIVIKK